MSSAETEMEPLTSGASNRIIPLLKALRASLIFVYTFFLSFLFFILPRRRRLSAAAGPPSPKKHLRQRWLVREEEDTCRRRALAQDYLGMGRDEGWYRWSTSIFYGVRNNALFCRSWFPVSDDVRSVFLSLLHSLYVWQFHFNTSSPFILTEFCQTLLLNELLSLCTVLHLLASCVHVENSRDRD